MKIQHFFFVSFVAAIAEMLLQSTTTDVYLLPALPTAKWANGFVKGLKARGGITVNITWKEGDLQEVSLWSTDHSSVRTLHHRGTTATATVQFGKICTFNRDLECFHTCSL